MARFNLNSYFALDAILRAPTLTEAARSIHLSQPAMSLALKRLREFFNDELVRYDHGRVELTPLAEQLKPKVADILARSREVAELSNSFTPSSDVRTLKISAPEPTLFAMLPPLIARVALEAPGITIEGVLPFRDGERTDRVDVSIVPEFAAAPLLPASPLFEERMGCLVHADTDFSDLDEETYRNLDHVALSPRQECDFWPEGDPATTLLRERRIVARVSSFEAVSRLIEYRHLIATTTGRMAQHHAAMRAPLLRAILAPRLFKPVLLVAQPPVNRVDDPAVRWLLRQVEAVADEFTLGGEAHLRRK